MAETRKKSTTTTKTKTVPAKKPATKPAGKSVAPKQTKTVKAQATGTASKKTTAKATKTTDTKSVSTTPRSTAKKQCNLCKVIFTVIVAVALVAVATWAIACVINKTANENITVENGNGDKVSMKYVSLEDYKYRVLVPSDFKELSADKIKEDYGTTEAPELVYANANDTVNIAFSAPNGTLADSQIKEYLDTMKTILSTGMDVISTNTYEADGHTISVIKLVSDFEGEKIYNQMAFFSYEDKLTIITFNCKGDARAEWEKVGDEIIKSINFTK